MKFLKNHVIKLVTNLGICLILMYMFAGCSNDDDFQPPQNPSFAVHTVASGLPGLMGIETDNQGNLWVTESGTDHPDAQGDTHNDNGKIILITPDGNQYDAIINLSSYANVHSGELQGTVHILRDNGTLYVLSGDYLYLANISDFHPGDAPIDATTLPKEDVSSAISSIYSPNNPEQDSHPYNLCKGPDGDLYITDSGANAILHRVGENDYSILAEIPAIENPSFPGLGGPEVQSVPTSISYDGHEFLVTTLTGFPFPQGKAVIYTISMSGTVSVYQDEFTMLVDQAEGSDGKHLVVQYAASFNPATGYAPDSGALISVDGSTQTILVDHLNQPVGIKQVHANEWYVTSLGDGLVLKVTYQ